jgi:hypothetical protein
MARQARRQSSKSVPATASCLLLLLLLPLCQMVTQTQQ